MVSVRGSQSYVNNLGSPSPSVRGEITQSVECTSHRDTDRATICLLPVDLYTTLCGIILLEAITKQLFGFMKSILLGSSVRLLQLMISAAFKYDIIQ